MAKQTSPTSRKSKSKTKAAAVKVRPKLQAPKTRRLQGRRYQSLHLSPRIKHTAKLPSAWRLSKLAAGHIWRHKRLFIAITLVYGLLNLLLVRGLSSTNDITTLKSQLNQYFTGDFASLASGLTVFVTLLGSSGNGSSNTAGAYQFFLLLLASLAIIWALRQTAAGISIRMRDAYYRGMYPVVPFILVLFVVGLQLLPMLIGVSLYALVISNGIAVLGIEKVIWGLLALVLTILSLYLICSSIFALYIVTLPDMTPLKALRSARDLVRHRRWVLLRKLLFLPLLLIIVAAIIMLPIIFWLTPLAQWVFFLLTTFAVLAVHAYLYNLYRELLHD